VYEEEKRQAEEWFLANYLGSDANGGTYVFETFGRKCGETDEPRPATAPLAAVALVDYEDETSGGYPMCLRCFLPLVQEEGFTEETAAEAWQEWTKGGLWFLFAPPGRYDKTGEWPYDEERK
jgi:hypothetical protein